VNPRRRSNARVGSRKKIGGGGFDMTPLAFAVGVYQKVGRDETSRICRMRRWERCYGRRTCAGRCVEGVSYSLRSPYFLITSSFLVDG
jgi:hypothetical protein